MDPESRSLLIIFIILVFFSAFFSCTESAVSLMNKIRIKNMADDGNKRAKKALFVSNNFEKALTTLLIGNNIVNIAAASVATLLVMHLLKNSDLDEGAKSAIATVCTTCIIFLFGEMIPKSLANDRPLGTALRLSGILTVIMKLFTPLSALFGMISKGVSKLFKGEDTPSITEEELIDIIDTAEEEGVVDEEQSDLLKSAIEFTETTAKSIMTMREDIVALDISMSNQEIMQKIKETTHSRLPMCDGGIDNIIGTLPIRSFIKQYYKNSSLDARQLLIPPFFVSKDAKIDDLLSVMRQHKFHLAVVSDEEHKTLGVVTIEDFLEELVGEIWDEDEVIDNNFIKLGGNKFRISTKMNVGEAFAKMNCTPPPSNIASKPIISWIIEKFGKMPCESEHFVFDRLEITVDEIEGGVVSHVEVHILEDGEITDENSLFAINDSALAETDTEV